MAMMDEREVSYKNTGDSLLLKALGKYPKLRIIDIFLTNPLLDFSKKGLVRELRTSKQTLYKYFKDLEELGMVKVTRKIGRATLYKLNLENPRVKMLNVHHTVLPPDSGTRKGQDAKTGSLEDNLVIIHTGPHGRLSYPQSEWPRYARAA